jgi:putative ABC transport system ATP-binding protein
VTDVAACTRTGADVEVKNVTRLFRSGDEKVLAVDNVSLAVEAGATVAVTGASGSGKSTLLHLVGAIERCDAGSIRVDGFDFSGQGARRLAKYRRQVGFVFQRFHLLPALTALDNVLLPVLPYRVDFDKRARALQLLDAVGLSGREHSMPNHLSGGQQQRVAVARALIGRPKLLLADEPTGNLDTATGAAIIDLLLSVRAEFRMTMLIATHESAVASRCERLIALRDGRLVSDSAEAAG